MLLQELLHELRGLQQREAAALKSALRAVHLGCLLQGERRDRMLALRAHGVADAPGKGIGCSFGGKSAVDTLARGGEAARYDHQPRAAPVAWVSISLHADLHGRILPPSCCPGQQLAGRTRTAADAARRKRTR